MDKFSNNLILEKAIMMDKIDEWRTNLFLLIHMDYNISEHTQDLAKIIYTWPKKLDKILEEAYKKHYEDRDAIETKMVNSRQKFEKEMAAFEETIKEIESYDDLFSYPTTVIPIRDYNNKLQEMKARKDRLEVEENILIGFKSAFESYFRVEKFFEPHYKFWTVTEKFIDKKKLWKSSTASRLDIEEVRTLTKYTQDVIKKIKNKLGNDQGKLVKDMLRQIKDLESCLLIIETLSNPGLKDRHWIEVKKISGPDLDFKKLSIDRIRFLKIEYMIESILKISEIASKEYSIELFLLSMDEQLEKNRVLLNIDKYSVEELDQLKAFKDLLKEQQSNIKTLRSNKNVGPLMEMLETQSQKTNDVLAEVENRLTSLTQ